MTPENERTSQSECPDDATVDRLVSGTLDPVARTMWLEHAADCTACCDLLAALATDTASTHENQSATTEGITVDRYRVIGTLGSGGMGVVYSAYDSQLDRNVALKLLHRGDGGEGGGDREGGESTVEAERLLREARAMAKLSHPNVVRVFDVGVSEGRVFVAMELVEHGTLRAWLEAEKRPWRQILSLFRQAGEGLAAAHRVGLVHRDFKPENLLVRDGNVLVTDFGLARAVEASAAPSSATQGPKLLAWDATNVAGTPVYMAPEQLTGEALDARADIFAFSVALWEALYGARPFSPDGPGGLLGAIAEGPREPKRDPGVPEHVRRALTKGMAFHKRDRPRSIDDLLVACEIHEKANERPVRRMALIMLFGITLVGVGFGARAITGGSTVVSSTDAGIRSPAQDVPTTSIVPSGAIAPSSAPLAALPAKEPLDAASIPAPKAEVTSGKSEGILGRPGLAAPVADSLTAGDAGSGSGKPPTGGRALQFRSVGVALVPFGNGAPALIDTFRHGFDGCASQVCPGATTPNGPRSGSSYCRAHVDAAGHVTGGSCASFVGNREVSCHAFERCVVGRAKSFVLPKPEDGPGDVTMNFVFVEK